MRIALFVICVGVTVLADAKPPKNFNFIENKNQWDNGTYFASVIPGGAMHVRGGGFAYFFLDHARLQEIHERGHSGEALEEVEDNLNIDGVMVKVSFVGSNVNVVPSGIARGEGYYNYFLGTDENKWASGAYCYNGVYYKSLYEGVDLTLYQNGSNLKYDLMVAPGADPALIRIRYEGVDELRLENGDLRWKTRFGEITEKRPIAWQYVEGKKKFIKCEFVIKEGEIAFDFPEGFDSCHQIVIDPLLIFSTYSGSQADNWGSTATPGERGTLYSSGITNHFAGNQFSGTFPATAGAFQTTYGGIYDVAIIKYDSVGTKFLYASYLGGSDVESPHSLVVNKNNELLVLGTTGSSDFPVSPNAYQKTFGGGSSIYTVFPYNNGLDIFVARISADGKNLLASTFLGGDRNDGANFQGSELRANYGDDLRGDIIADADGNIYVSTVTASENYPALNAYNGGITDGIIFRLPPGLDQLTWARYMGGSNTDAAHTIKFGKTGTIFVAGGTTSSNFPVAPGSVQPVHAGSADGWIAELSTDGTTVLNSTFSGSADWDQIYFIDVNASGEVYAYGQTDGDRPITPPDIFHNENSGQFLQKFSPDLSQQLFYTTFGSGSGHPDISPTAFLVNDCNNLYMAGWGGSLLNSLVGGWPTSTSGLAVTDDAYQSTTSGNDFYFLVLSDDAKERLYATFMGGNVSHTHVDGGTSRFDKQGIVYHAVCAACGGNDDFPTTPGVVSRTNNSTNCNNAAFKFDLSSLKALIDIKGGVTDFCLPQAPVFLNESIGGETYFWNFGDGTPIVKHEEKRGITHHYANPGKYQVWLKAYDPKTCRTSDSVSLFVNIGIAEAEVPDDTKICQGTSQTLTATGGVSYLWYTKEGSFTSASPSISVSPAENTWYFIDVQESAGCISRDSVFVEVIPKLIPEFAFERLTDCHGEKSGVSVKNLTDSLMAGDQIYFDFGDGQTSDLDEVIHQYETSGQFNLKVVAVRDMCVSESTVPLMFGRLKFPNVITPGEKEGKNDTFVIQYGDHPDASPHDYGYKASLVVYDRWGRKVYENNDYQSEWSGEDLSTGVYFYEVNVQDHTSCKGWVHIVK